MKKLLLFFLLIPFGFSLSFGQSWEWGKESIYGGEGYAVAADINGSAYVTGDFQYEMIYGNDTLKSNVQDAYLAKYDKNGNFLWAQQSHCTSASLSFASGEALATDKSGNIYMGGVTRDTVYFGSYMLTTPAQQGTPYLAKYDVSGRLLWALQGIAPTFTSLGQVRGIACDKNNNVYITGVFADTLIFGVTVLKTSGGHGAFFLVKYDSNGNQLFAKQCLLSSTNADCTTLSMSVDGHGNSYLTGFFTDTVSIGSNTLISSGTDIFICKYDSLGNVLWAKQGIINTGGSYDDATSIVVDNYGNTYITGDFRDSLLFDNLRLYSSKNTFCVVKFDATGNAIWGKVATTPYNQVLYSCSLAISDQGKIYFSGDAGVDSADITIDTFTIKGNNLTDGSILLEFDTAGNVLCGALAQTGGDDQNAVACDPSGEYVFFGGDGGSAAIFGPDTLQVSMGWEPSLVARWQPCDVNNDASVNSINHSSENISVFPNPNNGKFTMQTSAVNGQLSVEVYNVLGEKVYTNYQITKSSNYQIDLSNQPNGIYLYRVISQDGSLIESGKVIIEK